jgi:L-lactate dehydrogenase complex protein LldF
MKIRCEQIQELSKKALRDGHLQKALQGLGSGFKTMRDSAFSMLDGAEALREEAHKVKARTLDRLDEYLEHLERKVVQWGGEVHWARDASQARGLIEGLAMDRGVKKVVKGKSMVTEEIALNEGLIARGIEVSETDLGEFIIQLAEEPPSHLVGPALHKTKEQVAELFTNKLSARPTEDPQEMTMFARKTLRQRFLEADMGITGVNFAVAETGSIVLFENEGNIRLSTTIPKIHVAVMSMEKVVPTLDDLAILMKLLARSCSGQKLSTYVSIFHGPRRDGEPDGADEFHLVILDNGRTKILADEALKEALYCIRCGACLNFCPVYLKIGGHAYGWVYSGPIGSILTPQLINRKQAHQLPYASTLCGACADVCPVKIDIPRILVALRERYVENAEWDKPTSPIEKGAFALYASIMRSRWLYEKGSWMARCLQIPLTKEGRLRDLPPPLNKWSSYHEVNPFEKKTFRQMWRDMSKRNKGFGDER